jgi:hypothetical protein
MPRTKKSGEVPVDQPVEQANTSGQDLVNALVQAIQLTRPVEKKTSVSRKPGSPWDPKDGSKKLKLKRKVYQHSILIDPDFHTNEEIELMNRLKVGRFCDGNVKVYRRKDHGIDIDYPVKTASQRIKLFKYFTNFKGLLERCIEEAANPRPAESIYDDEN